MRREAAEISDRDLDRRLGVPATRDEIAALGTTINALLARLQGALHRERGFVADAGHELRTPLAILRAELELAARPGRSREALVDAINEAGAETDRLIRLAEDLLLLARADNHQPFLRPRRLSVPTCCAPRRAAQRPGRPSAEVTSHRHVPEILDVPADPDRLRQAVDNLLDNATRHSPRGGVVELSAGIARRGVLAIEVEDRGLGFPVDFLPHAFDRFHRAGDARSRDDGGSGLGLSIVRAIVRAHGGAVVATNRAGGGAAVRIELPAVGSPTTPVRPGEHGRLECRSWRHRVAGTGLRRMPRGLRFSGGSTRAAAEVRRGIVTPAAMSDGKCTPSRTRDAATARDSATVATTATARLRRCRTGNRTTSREAHSAVVPVVCPEGKLNPAAVVSGCTSGRGRASAFFNPVSTASAATRTSRRYAASRTR
jgi:hypothetical protein